MDKLGVIHVNQTSMCLDQHLNFLNKAIEVGTVKPI